MMADIIEILLFICLILIGVDTMLLAFKNKKNKKDWQVSIFFWKYIDKCNTMCYNYISKGDDRCEKIKKVGYIYPCGCSLFISNDDWIFGYIGNKGACIPNYISNIMFLNGTNHQYFN